MRNLVSAVTGPVDRMRRIAGRQTVSRSSRVLGVLAGRRSVSVLGVMGCLTACFAVAGGAAASVSPRPAPVARYPLTQFEARGVAGASPARLGHPGISPPGQLSHRGRSVPLSGIAAVPAANPRTGTLYVPVQSGHVVDVINAARCNARVGADCRVVARARVGTSPLAVTIDEQTNTIYAVNNPPKGTGTVSVVNGARCNARVTRGCGRPLATIKVGKFPVAAAFNPATRTLYVANLVSGGISVIDAARCNAVTTRGCRHPVKSIKDRFGPDAVDVNVATNTVYAANAGLQGNGHTVSVINGATCNGHTASGCGQTPRIAKVGSGPFWVTVDQARNTIYVVNNNDGTVSVINGARCNATVGSGCHRTPPTVTTGTEPQFVVADNALHTAFVANQGDGTLSAINTRTCNGKVTSGCRTRPPNQEATFDPRHGANPNAFALLGQTAYLVNIGSGDIVSVVSIRRCNAIHASGCRREAPSVPNPEFLFSIDPATNTVYAGNTNLPQIDVLNGATCNAGHLSGCAPVAAIPMADPQANMGKGSIDPATHTLYASDPFKNTVSVINTATCNATHTAGCAHQPPVMKIGAAPGPPALNPATHTLYLPFGSNANKVAVVNAAACNAQHTSGCKQAPGVVKVGSGTFLLAVSAATDTVYAPSTGAPSFNSHAVAVINGATCNGTHHSGCGHLAATVRAGLAPFDVAVNDRTHTVYVSNFARDDLPGTVSVINGATCNGSRASGCAGHMPTAQVGRSPQGIAVDFRTNTIYVADLFSAAVSKLNGSKCRAGMTRGCRHAVPQQAVVSLPVSVGVNPRTHTVYVTGAFQTGSMSIFRATR
jgi:DNA-binding beta-propeller fold protein YncE